jgi:hypothetical protein
MIGLVFASGLKAVVTPVIQRKRSVNFLLDWRQSGYTGFANTNSRVVLIVEL